MFHFFILIQFAVDALYHGCQGAAASRGRPIFQEPRNYFSCLIAYFSCRITTLVAGLLASSQYPEGPATGHLGTGFSWFPCV